MWIEWVWLGGRGWPFGSGWLGRVTIDGWREWQVGKPSTICENDWDSLCGGMMRLEVPKAFPISPSPLRARAKASPTINFTQGPLHPCNWAWLQRPRNELTIDGVSSDVTVVTMNIAQCAALRKQRMR